METQNAQIKAYLQSGKSLTALDALHLFNCFRLGARIHNLKRTGMMINKEMIKITSGGKTKRVAKYTLVK